MDSYEGRDLVVLTSAEGANRVYDAGVTCFERFDTEGFVVDSNGCRWMVSEDDLTLVGDRIEILVRIPSQRAFWFGWYAQFPNTCLVH